MSLIGTVFFTASTLSTFVNRLSNLIDPIQNIDCKIPVNMDQMKSMSDFIESNPSRFVIFDCDENSKLGAMKHSFQDSENPQIIHIARFMVCALSHFIQVGADASPQDYFERTYTVEIFTQ